MNTENLCLTFKGERNYLQGPDIFNGVVERLEVPESSEIFMAFHELIGSPGIEIFYGDDQSDLAGVEGRVANGYFGDKSNRIYFAVKSYDSQCERKSQAYDESKVVDNCHVDGQTITQEGESPYSFMETVVSMNKNLLQTLYPEAKGKWLFTRIELSQVPSFRSGIQLELLHNLNFKLTKSVIRHEGVVLGNIYFTMVPK